MVGECWYGSRGPDCRPLISPKNGLRDEVVKKLRVFGPALAEHVARQIFQKRDLILAWFFLSFRQIPRVNRLVTIERHGDHPSTHQLNQRTIRIATLKDRNQRVASGGHQKKLLHHNGLSSACLGHHKHVRVAQAGVKRRERNELAVGSFKQKQW